MENKDGRNKKMKEELKRKMDYLDEVVAQCESLKKEWEDRIQEAEEAKDNLQELIRYMAIKNQGRKRN